MTPRSGPATPPRATVRLLAGALATALLAGSCTLSPGVDEEPDLPDGSAVVPERPDLTGSTVPRRAFCDTLPESLAADALGGPVAETGHYLNGEEVEIRPGYVDVAHEFGCVYRAADATTARAWVFARPVLREEARTLVRRARASGTCAFPRALPFGSPGLASVCEVPARKSSPAQVRARLEGLFGDTWVGCEVTEPADRATAPGTAGRRDVVQRADTWCVEVILAIADRP